MLSFNRKLLLASLMIITLDQYAWADDLLTGDQKLACEAILCLSSATQPAECSPSISRYFSITRRKFGDTLNARRAFLNLCPTANQTSQMSNLVSALVEGSGRCDANSLNSMLRRYTGDDNRPFVISNQMPGFCKTLFNQPYTDFKQSNQIPKYVGKPELGGLWATPQEYEQILAQYTARIKAEDQAREKARLADMQGG